MNVTDGVPMYQPNYNPSPASMAQTNQMSIFTNSVHTPPVSTHLENFAYNHISASSFLVRDESSSFRKEGEDTFIRMFQDEAPRQHCDELLQSIVESSCVGNSTPFKATKDFGKQRQLEIDLNRTPEQRPPKRRQHMPMVSSGESFTDLLSLPLDESLSLYEETQENFVTVPLDEATQKRHDELLKDLTDTLSAAVSTPMKEVEKGSDQVIDLNKTPEQKTPKRRKHRPKVIKEGKAKKTPKPVTPKIPKETPTGKRKYVRKKNIQEAATPPANIVEIRDSSTATKTKSCRRVIHFEMEKTGDEEQEKKQNEKDMLEENAGNFCFIARPDVPNFCTQSNSVCGTSLDVHSSSPHPGTMVAENVGSLGIPVKRFESGLYATLYKRYSTIQANEGCSSHLNTSGCNPINSVGFTAEMKQAMLNSHARSNQSTDRQNNWTKEMIGDTHVHSVVHENIFQGRQVSYNNLHQDIDRTYGTTGLNRVAAGYRSLITGEKCNVLQSFPHPKASEQGYACRKSDNRLTLRQVLHPMASGSVATNGVKNQGYSFGFQQFPDKTTGKYI